MAALAGLQIDNCEVWVDDAEMPGCDGSSLPFVAALDAAGIVEQAALRPRLVVREHHAAGRRRQLGRGPARARRRTVASSFASDYGSGNAIGRQTLQLPVTPESFRRELAPAARSCCRKKPTGWSLAGWASGPRIKTCWSSTRTGRSTTNCDSATSACGTRRSTWSAIWPWPVATWWATFVAHRSGHRLNAELVRVLLNEEEMDRKLAAIGVNRAGTLAGSRPRQHNDHSLAADVHG